MSLGRKREQSVVWVGSGCEVVLSFFLAFLCWGFAMVWVFVVSRDGRRARFVGGELSRSVGGGSGG